MSEAAYHQISRAASQTHQLRQKARWYRPSGSVRDHVAEDAIGIFTPARVFSGAIDRLPVPDVQSHCDGDAPHLERHNAASSLLS